MTLFRNILLNSWEIAWHKKISRYKRFRYYNLDRFPYLIGTYVNMKESIKEIG